MIEYFYWNNRLRSRKYVDLRKNEKKARRLNFLARFQFLSFRCGLILGWRFLFTLTKFRECNSLSIRIRIFQKCCRKLMRRFNENIKLEKCNTCYPIHHELIHYFIHFPIIYARALVPIFWFAFWMFCDCDLMEIKFVLKCNAPIFFEVNRKTIFSHNLWKYVASKGKCFTAIGLNNR